MRRNPSTKMKSLLYGNMHLLIAVFFCFVLGISLGSFTELFLSSEAKESMWSFLDFHLLLPESTGNFIPELLVKSLATNFGLFLIILLSGITIIGFPAAPFALIYKGAALGFSAALLMDTMGARGVLLVLLTLLPANLFLIPALCCASAASLRLSFDLLSSGPLHIKKSLTGKASSFMTFQGLTAILLLVGCLVEALISPLLQQLLK